MVAAGSPMTIRIAAAAAGLAAGTARHLRSPGTAAVDVDVEVREADHRSGAKAVAGDAADAAGAPTGRHLLHRNLVRCNKAVAPVGPGAAVVVARAAEAVTADMKGCGAPVAGAAVEAGKSPAVVDIGGVVGAAAGAAAVVAVSAADAADKRIADKVAPGLVAQLGPGLSRRRRGPETLERSLR